ncbi:MAG TPA: ATP-binding protein [Gaiellaceae bacterium]|nr:ATP-binding protein [Gaiellaceae bacterium]
MLAGWLVWRSPLVPHPETMAVAKGLIVAAYVGVGVYTLARRRGTRLGPLIAGAGLLFAVTSLSAVDRPFPHTVGRVALAALVVFFAYLFASFPRGRPQAPVERRFVAAAVVLTVVPWAAVLAFADRLPHGGPLSDCTTGCPGNALQLVDTSNGVTDALGLAATSATMVIVVGAIALLGRKAAYEPLVRRRALTPLIGASILLAATYGAYSLISEAASPPGTAFRAACALGALAIPVALLFGQVRGRLIATSAMWREMAQVAPQNVTPAWLQEFLRHTLGDPSFALALWNEEHSTFVDVAGEPVSLPSPTASPRSITLIARRGLPSLALVHDVALDEDIEIVQGLGVTAATLLENATLVGELQASRARIVESVEQERHRLERDLHDGAQQRLTTIQLKLAVASEEAQQAALRAELEEVAAEAAAAAGELRAVAHGIYPPLLHDAGVAPALRAVAGRAPIRVRMIDRGIGRAPAGTELAIYYCALEALQNAAKHAGPSAQAVVTLARSRDELVFEIRDDGTGFDPPANGEGIGLLSMRDRIGAVGGRLEIRSSPGAGTSVRGTVPVA